jgi:hypothetical protein
MTPAQIEGFIDRICGLFPTSQIGRNTVKNAWTADDFLLLQDVDDARKVVPLIMEHHDKFTKRLLYFANLRQSRRLLYARFAMATVGITADDGITTLKN